MNAPERDAALRAAERRIAELERELLITQQQAAVIHAYLAEIYNVIPGAVLRVDRAGCVTLVNRGVADLLGYQDDELMGGSLARVWGEGPAFVDDCLRRRTAVVRAEAEWRTKAGDMLPVFLSATLHRAQDAETESMVLVALDLRERRRLEMDVRHAHKLEALGQLAAGVAHEINTPMQYVGDNLHFVHDTFQGLLPLLDLGAQMVQALDRSGAAPELAQRARQAADAADLDFARERLPTAVERALEGVERVSQIVEAMKGFSHLETEKRPVDLNRALLDTLTVARNEYKYVAEVVTELGELPAVVCNVSDLNQVFLNLIVNAVHAIEPVMEASGRKGTITLRTARDGDGVRIDIADTGSGIPEDIRHRIFDPFFTTKEVGRGTGQGLAISRSIVVDRHGGSLTFDSAIGQGTTFHIRLPIEGVARKEAA